MFLRQPKNRSSPTKKGRCVQYSAFVFSINCCPAAGLVVLLVVAGEWFTLITPNTCLLCLFFFNIYLTSDIILRLAGLLNFNERERLLTSRHLVLPDRRAWRLQRRKQATIVILSQTCQTMTMTHHLDLLRILQAQNRQRQLLMRILQSKNKTKTHRRPSSIFWRMRRSFSFHTLVKDGASSILRSPHTCVLSPMIWPSTQRHWTHF